jgi:predicted transcriptional regulator of viral defense system
MPRHNLTPRSPAKKRERVLALAKKAGLIRPRDVVALGISGEYLNKLLAEGELERPTRGVYRLPNRPITEQTQLAEVAKRVPNAVVTLLSALQFHGLTTQLPHEIWIAIPEGMRTPRIDYPPVRVTRFASEPYQYGIEKHQVDGVEVKVYSAAKTVADCFKLRSQIGLDVALEALRDCRRQRKATADQLWEAAKICRMTNVMKPYMEALL